LTVRAMLILKFEYEANIIPKPTNAA
jgi:hypothetical protein